MKFDNTLFLISTTKNHFKPVLEIVYSYNTLPANVSSLNKTRNSQDQLPSKVPYSRQRGTYWIAQKRQDQRKGRGWKDTC